MLLQRKPVPMQLCPPNSCRDWSVNKPVPSWLQPGRYRPEPWKALYKNKPNLVINFKGLYVCVCIYIYIYIYIYIRP